LTGERLVVFASVEIGEFEIEGLSEILCGAGLTITP
jgi:hypothetical protein